MNRNDEEEEKPLLLKVEPTASSGDGSTVTAVLFFSIVTAIFASFVHGFAMGYSSPVQSRIVADLGLSIADYSLFGSILKVGTLIGSLLCGKLTDYIGRRGTMALSALLFFIGWPVIAFSQRAWSLDLGRLSLGFADGLCCYVIPVYIAEVTPKNLRGGAVLLNQLMLAVGIASAYLVGLVTNWRILALIGALPCLAIFVGLIIIPESPRWLVKVGNEKEFEASLKNLRGKNMDISHEAFEIKEFTEAAKNMSEDSFLSIFQMKYAHLLTISLGLMALNGFCGNSGVVFYASSIFESAGFSKTIGTAAMGLIQVPPTIIGVFLMDNFGRRSLLLGSTFATCTGYFLVALSFLMKEHGLMKDFSPYLALFGILIAAATYPIGMGIPFLIMSEILPINIKGAAGSLGIVILSVSSWIVAYTFNFLMDWSSSGTFFIYMSINFLGIIYIYKLVPETKGRTLENIQDSLITNSLHSYKDVIA